MIKKYSRFRFISFVFFVIVILIKLLVYADFINPYFNLIFVGRPILASLLIISSFSFLFNKKGSNIFLYILDILISILLIADINYFRYYKDIITIPVIRNGVLLGAVSNAVKSIIKPQDLLFLLDIVLIPILSVFTKHFKTKDYSLYNKPAHNSIKTRIILFVVIFCIGIFSNNHFINKLRAEQPGLLEGMYNKIYISNTLGSLNCHALDAKIFIEKTILSSRPVDEDVQANIKNYLLQNTKQTGTNLKGIGEGKNLIMIQVEALQEFVIGREIEGQEITPNLNRWIKKSLYFDNYYYQVAGGNTSDAEFMSNNSLYPAASGAAYYQYSRNTLVSLPHELKSKGYYTASLHPYKSGFWNRNAMYKAEGFDDFFSEINFNIDEKIGLGLSDESFFKQSLEKLDSFKTPYYSFLITLTSHFPYDDVEHYGDFNVGEYEGTFIGNYLKSIHYTDEQLGMFLDALEEKGTLDDSILVLYGDHFAIPKNHADQLYSFVGVDQDNELNWMKYQKVPLMIHFPGNEYKGINHETAGQMDLYPTLSNIFNLNNRYMFGRDIFNNDDRLVVFRSGSFTDGKVFYSSSSNKYYDMESNEEIQETPELKNKKLNAQIELNYSDTLLDHNLIKKFINSKE